MVYLNEDWQESWGGALEFWPTLESGPTVTINPIMNRTAVFSTQGAAHGHPKPVNAPGGRSRLCFSACYFTSPDLDASPGDHHGVLFADAGPSSKAAALARAVIPPIALDGARALRRQVRRRRAQA
jgi:hypothetical protein